METNKPEENKQKAIEENTMPKAYSRATGSSNFIGAKRAFSSWMEDNGYVIRSAKGNKKYDDAKLKSKENRVKVIRKIVEVLGIDPLDLKNEDLFDIGVFSLLMQYSLHNGGSTPANFNAIKEAYPEKDINVWDMKIAPNIMRKNEAFAKEAIKWILKHNHGVIKESDLQNEKFAFVLGIYKNVFDAVIFSEATSIKPSCMRELADKYLDESFIGNQTKRKAALKFIIKIKGMQYDVSYADLKHYGIEKIINNYNTSKPYGITAEDYDGELRLAIALNDMLPEFNMWEMSNPPKQLFINEKVRAESTLWLSKKLNKSVYRLNRKDWEKLNLTWILDEFYNGYADLAIKDAVDLKFFGFIRKDTQRP